MLASITALTINFREAGLVDSLRSGASDLASPVADAARSAFRPVTNAWNGVFEYPDVKKENDLLRQQYEEMRGELATAQAQNNQVEQLRELTQLDKLWLAQPGVVAEVIGGTPSNFDGTIELNRGSRDGIAKDDIVVTGAGLLGRVVEAATTRSRVLPITDPRSTIQVSLPEVPDVGRAKGKGEGKPLEIAGIDVDPDHPVKKGYIIKTSGERSLAPADIPVGVVSEVVISPGSLSTLVRATPAADLSRLRFVKVLASGAR